MLQRILGHIQTAIANIEHELQEMLQAKINASIFRTRVHYTKDGEKNSRYFFNLEKEITSLKIWSPSLDEMGKLSENNQKYLRAKAFL